MREERSGEEEVRVEAAIAADDWRLDSVFGVMGGGSWELMSKRVSEYGWIYDLRFTGFGVKVESLKWL